MNVQSTSRVVKGIAAATVVLIELLLSTNDARAWVRRFDGTASRDDAARAIARDAEGNIYVTGSASNTGTGTDFVTIKYTPSGKMLWVRFYDGPSHGDDDAYAVAVDADGGVYVTGDSFDLVNDMDYVTVKYDADGNQLWVQRYDGPDHRQDHARAIALDGRGQIYVTGSSDSEFTEFDFATVAYDRDGHQLWVQRYNGPDDGYDSALAIAVGPDGAVYVTGSSEDEETGLDFVTVRYDADGTERWVARYDGPAHLHDNPSALAVSADGRVYVTGRSTGPNGYWDITTLCYMGDTGEQCWALRFNDNDHRFDNMAFAIAVDSRGSVYLAGSSVGSQYGEFVTLKYGADGTEQWVRFYRGPADGPSTAYALALDRDGDVYVTGSSYGVGTGQDYTTVKYDADGTEQWVRRYNGPANREDVAAAIVVGADRGIYVTGYSVGIGTGRDCVTIRYRP